MQIGKTAFFSNLMPYGKTVFPGCVHIPSVNIPQVFYKQGIPVSTIKLLV
jgi:hypothetical protein